MQTSTAFNRYLRKQFESALVESVLWVEGQRLRKLHTVWRGEPRSNVMFRAYAKTPEGLAETLMFANMAPRFPNAVGESLAHAKSDSLIWENRVAIHSAVRRANGSVPLLFEAISENLIPAKAAFATQLVIGLLGGLDESNYRDYVKGKDLMKHRLTKVLGRCENESLKKYMEALDLLRDYPMDVFWDCWADHTGVAECPTQKPTHKILRWASEQLVEVDESEQNLLDEIIPLLEGQKKSHHRSRRGCPKDARLALADE